MIPSILSGFLIVRLLWPNGLRLCRHDVFRASLGIGIGLGLSSIVCFLAVAFAGGNRAVVIGAELAILALLAAAYWLFRRKSPCAFCAAGETESKPVPRWLWASAAAIILTSAVIFVLFESVFPHGYWDAWAIWNMHARFLARGGADWLNMFSPHLGYTNLDYPLLIPGAVANEWIWTGSESTLAPMLIAGWLFIGTIGVVAGGLQILRGTTQALIALVTLLGGAEIVRLAAQQYADAPTAFFYVAAVLTLAMADRVQGAPWLAGALAACAAWTKNEGIVFFVVFVVAAIFSMARTGRLASHWRRIVALMAGAVPVLAMIMVYKVAYTPPNYLFVEKVPLSARLGDVSRYMTVLVEFGKQLFTFAGFISAPVIVLVAYLWLVGIAKDDSPRTGRVTASVTLLLMTIAYFGVYIFTTKELNWQIETSLSRVLMHLWPLAVATLFLYTRSPDLQAQPKPVEPKREKTKATAARPSRRR